MVCLFWRVDEKDDAVNITWTIDPGLKSRLLKNVIAMDETNLVYLPIRPPALSKTIDIKSESMNGKVLRRLSIF